MLANVITHEPTFVDAPHDLLDGDVVIDARNRKCAVRYHKRGQLSLVKPRSGNAFDYALPNGGKIVVVGRVEGGWNTALPATQVKRTSKPDSPKAEKVAKPRKRTNKPASTNADALAAVADMLDAASAALRTVATLV